MSTPLSVLVVDDEAPAVRRLQRLLDQQSRVRCVGTAAQAAEAIAACRQLHPDVVLLDVEMPGMDGVQAARELMRLPQPPQVIFVTAFERYAVDAFDLQALDYLVKPVRAERLEQALERAAQAVARQRARGAILTARLGEKLLVIPVAEIRLLQAEDKYTCVHYPGGQALIDDSLLSLEERFGDHFIRVHRAALVSRAHLRALFRDGDGQERVQIDGCTVTPEVSRRSLAGLRRQLKAG